MKKFLFLTLASLSLHAFAQHKWNYPPTPKIPVYDTVFGRIIKDDYRWMEKADDPKFVEWLHAQNRFADSVKNLIPGQEMLQQELKDILKTSGDYYSHFQKTNSHWVYVKEDAAKNGTSAVYKKNIATEKEEMIFDPENFQVGKTFVLSGVYTYAKSDLALINMYTAGDEITIGRIINLVTGEILKDSVKGFEPRPLEINGEPYIVYKKGNSDNVRAADRYKDATISLHKIGSNENETELFKSSKIFNRPVANKSEVYRFYSSPQSHYAMVLFFDGKMENNIVFWAKKTDLFKPKIPWQKIKAGDTEMGEGKEFILRDNAYYYLSTSTNPAGEIKRTPFDEAGVKTVFIPENGWIIEKFSATKDYLVFTVSKNAVESKIISYDLNTKKIRQLGQVIKGFADIWPAGYSTNFTIVSNSNWTEQTQFLQANLERSQIVPSFFNPPASPNQNIVVEEVEVKSHDGVMVPLSIVYDKTKMKKDGSNIAAINGYGAFGNSMKPLYSPFLEPLLRRGMVLTTAHVRGGGEKGQEWHRSAMLEKKPNSWKDLNTCAEWLIANKYTSADKLSINGSSAAGVLIGMANTSRPDLYRAVVCGVGVLNMSRFHTAPNAAGMVYEIGDISKQEQAKWVLDADAYLNIKNGVAYPAQVITAGYNDPRVVVWQPAKYAAAMQAASSSGLPVLLSLNMEGGHGGGTMEDMIKNFAWDMTFRLWQCGHPDFQPKK